MYELLIYSLKAGACLAVFYLFFKLLLSRETFHRFNRAVVLGAVVLSFVLPLCVITVVHELPEMSELPEVSEPILSAEPQPEPFPWDKVAGGAFLAGAAATLGWTLWSLFCVLRLVGRGRRERLDDGAVLVRLPHEVTPFSWGRYIVISERDFAESGAEIITHERAHLRLHHSWDLLVTDIAGCLQWFNPAMWLLRRELRAIHEYEADEAVLESGVDARHYQLMLIKKAAGGRWYSVANSFNHSKLKNRITMMLQKKSSRWAGAKALFVLPLTALALGAFARTAYVYPEDKVKKESVSIQISGSDISVSGVTGEPLVFVDGREMSFAAYKHIPASEIATMSVLNGDGVMSEYGERAKDGVILVTLKKAGEAAGASGAASDDVVVVAFGEGDDSQSEAAADRIEVRDLTEKIELGTANRVIRIRSGKSDTTGPDPVFLIDGKVVSGEELKNFNPANLDHMSVHKDMLDKYPNGVVIITTKSAEADAKAGVEAAKLGLKSAREAVEAAREYMNSEEWTKTRQQLEKAQNEVEKAGKQVSAEISATVAGAQKGAVARVRYADNDSESLFQQLGDNSVTTIKGRVTADMSGVSDQALIFLNGKPASKSEVAALKKIKRMQIFKGDEAVKRYGEKGRAGVVDIRTRK